MTSKIKMSFLNVTLEYLNVGGCKQMAATAIDSKCVSRTWGDSITMKKQQTSKCLIFEGRWKLCVCCSPVRVLFQFPTRVIILDLEFLHLCTAIYSHFWFYINHRRGENGKIFTGTILNNFSTRDQQCENLPSKKANPKKSVSFGMCECGLENNFSNFL